jgi:hypothetical protein
LDEEKSKNASLAQENDFGSAYLKSLLVAGHNDWSKWVAISSYLLSQFQFYGWGCRKVNN